MSMAMTLVASAMIGTVVFQSFFFLRQYAFFSFKKKTNNHCYKFVHVSILFQVISNSVDKYKLKLDLVRFSSPKDDGKKNTHKMCGVNKKREINKPNYVLFDVSFGLNYHLDRSNSISYIFGLR